MLGYILLSIFCAILLCTCIFLLLINKNLKKAFIQAKKGVPSQGALDPLLPSGMKVVNEFLRDNTLKFINSKLIELNEGTETPVTQFLANLSSDDKMSDFVSGFVMYINGIMSKDLKSFFNKYYNVIDDETGQINDVFIQYVSDWLILYVRKIQADISSQNMGSEDYSMQTNVVQNSNMFINIEMELYNRFNIIENTEEKK